MSFDPIKTYLHCRGSNNIKPGGKDEAGDIPTANSCFCPTGNLTLPSGVLNYDFWGVM